MMAPQSRANDWNEYKRLVLAELERHEEAILKLQEACTSLSAQIQMCQNTEQDNSEELDKISEKMGSFHSIAPPDAKWKFYAAVATVVGTAIVAIISLITALLGGNAGQ